MVSIDKPKQASQTNPQYRHYSDLILKIERTYPTKQWGCPRVRIAILIRVPNPKTRSTQKKMQEPEVPAFYFICLGVPPPLATDEGQWPGGGCLTSFSFCTCPLYFTWVFLSYLMPSHFIGIFSLGPSILFYFLGVPPHPLATDEGKYLGSSQIRNRNPNIFGYPPCSNVGCMSSLK